MTVPRHQSAEQGPVPELGSESLDFAVARTLRLKGLGELLSEVYLYAKELGDSSGHKVASGRASRDIAVDVAAAIPALVDAEPRSAREPILEAFVAANSFFVAPQQAAGRASALQESCRRGLAAVERRLQAFTPDPSSGCSL